MKEQHDCLASTVAKTSVKDSGKIRVCHLPKDHPGDHETIYCGSPYKWPNTQQNDPRTNPSLGKKARSHR